MDARFRGQDESAVTPANAGVHVEVASHRFWPYVRAAMVPGQARIDSPEKNDMNRRELLEQLGADGGKATSDIGWEVDAYISVPSVDNSS